ncbi:MAG TPA: hypothetical protein VF915_17030 [Reyranella sp.]
MLKVVAAVASIVLLTGSAAGSASAQQREARLLPGPMTERPIIRVACTAAELAQCKAGATNKCGDDKVCAASGVARCEAMCELQK